MIHIQTSKALSITFVSSRKKAVDPDQQRPHFGTGSGPQEIGLDHSSTAVLLASCQLAVKAPIYHSSNAEAINLC